MAWRDPKGYLARETEGSHMSWTDERVETLKKMWGDGQSASHIAKELGGVTRNAVIGKVHRLGLSNRAGTGAAAPAAKPAPKEKPSETVEAPSAKPASSSNPLCCCRCMTVPRLCDLPLKTGASKNKFIT